MKHTPRRSRVAALLVTAGLAGTLAACGSSDPTAASDGGGSGDGGESAESLVVGSFNFPESEILGEMYAQALEADGIEVERRFNIGARQQTIPALQDGSINLIPEYNGNLVAYYNPEFTERSTEEIDAVINDVIATDGLRALQSSPAEDKDAYVVTRETAEANDLVEIGDLTAIEPFRLGANPQFGELGYGIPGLASVYGVTDVEFVPIEDYGGPDTVKALVDDSVQVADIYTTSPALVAEDLVVLEDPENLIAAQNVVPVVAESAYTEEMAAVLDEVSAALSTEDLIALRERVEGDEQASAASAATDWLEQEGLL